MAVTKLDQMIRREIIKQLLVIPRIETSTAYELFVYPVLP